MNPTLCPVDREASPIKPYKKVVLGLGDDSIKCLLCEYEDLNPVFPRTPQARHSSWGGRDSRIPGAHWPDSSAELTGSIQTKWKTRPTSKKKYGGKCMIKEDTWHWAYLDTHTCTCTPIWMYQQEHVHTHKNILGLLLAAVDILPGIRVNKVIQRSLKHRNQYGPWPAQPSWDPVVQARAWTNGLSAFLTCWCFPSHILTNEPHKIIDDLHLTERHCVLPFGWWERVKKGFGLGCLLQATYSQ